MENMEKVINPTKTRQNHQLFFGSLCDWASSKKRPRHLVPRYLALDVEVMISLKATSGHANSMNLGARHIPKVSFRLLFLRHAKMGCNFSPIQTDTSILLTHTSKAGPSFFSSKFKYWGLGYQRRLRQMFCFYSTDSTVSKVESKNWTFSCLVSLLLFAGLQYMVDNLDKICIVRIEGKDFAFSHPPPPPAHHCSFPSCCIVQEGWGCQVQDGNRACILSEVKVCWMKNTLRIYPIHALLPPQSSDHSCPCHSQLLPLLPPFCTG